MGTTERRDAGFHPAFIWICAFGYFAAYVPYSALTKALSSGLLPGMARGYAGFTVVPATAVASLLGMFTFLTVTGWWRYAGRRRIAGRALPWPGRWTFLSGLATSLVIVTTTMAYTFRGISIVFMMLLMRGGVLAIAPVVDALSRRRVRWFSWVATGLSFGALLVAFLQKASMQLTLLAAVDVIVYLASYFVRLRLMSRLAKADDRATSLRYFVEEQMVATPALVLALGTAALIDVGGEMHAIRAGFTTFLHSGYLGTAVLIGLLSQGTGIFGGLIFLDKRENTFCVPVNRASSVLAGIGATCLLTVWLGQRPPRVFELVGAGLVIAAILVLTFGSMLGRRRAPAAAPVAPAEAAGGRR